MPSVRKKANHIKIHCNINNSFSPVMISAYFIVAEGSSRFTTACIEPDLPVSGWLKRPEERAMGL